MQSARGVALLAVVVLAETVSGQDPCDPIHVFTGERLLDTMGLAVATVGDINEDGIDDVAVASPFYDLDPGNVLENTGRVYVYSGADGTVIHTLDGQAPGDFFGFALAVGGDFDEDGLVDLVVGAYLADDAALDVGRVHVISMSDGVEIRQFSGAVESGYFGYSVACTEDIDGDGVPDILAGAPGERSLGNETGAAYLISGADGTILQTWTGQEGGSRFGVEVCFVGPINGGDVPNAAIGAPRYDLEAGRVTIHSCTTGDLLLTLDGESENDRFGESIAAYGLADGDAVPDILIAAPNQSMTGGGEGRLYIVSGADGSHIDTVTGEPGEQLGSDVISLGDLDGDEADEILVGAPSGGPDAAGRALVLAGSDRSVLREYVGEVSGDRFGGTVGIAGLLDEDERVEIVISAVWNDVGGINAGRSYLYPVCGVEPPLCPADLDGDGKTDLADLGILLAAYNVDDGGDLDGDGVTNLSDLGILLADYGCGT
jgi:hypothetical protein